MVKPLFISKCQRSGKNYNWIPGEFLFPKEKLISERYTTSILNVLRFIFLRKEKDDVAAMDEAAVRFVTLYPDYIEKCWNNINCIHKKNVNGLDLRFQKISYLYKLIQKIQILREQESNQIAIVDEGLIHLITNLLCKKNLRLKRKKKLKNLSK
ncbi:MAG: hypothetical protein WKG06_39825 [Segetibacter sp.]